MESTSTTSLALPHQQAALAKMRKANAKPQISAMPEIKFKQSDKEMGDLSKGNYYLKTFENETVKMKDIGPNPEIVILHRAYTYSYYDEDAETLRAWTSDIDSFDDFGTVYLFEKLPDGKVRIEKEGSYQAVKPSIKSPKYQMTKGEKVKNLMKFQSVLYVLYEGIVCRMFVSNASAVGIKEGEKFPDFDNPQLLSLEHFVSTTRGEEVSALSEFVCKLGSIYKKDSTVPYYILTFENVGRNEDIALAVDTYPKLMADREQKLQWDLDRIGGSSLKEAAIDAFGEDGGAVLPDGLKVEDLPF